MAALREIRANYDDDTIVMYQAYPWSIAKPALANQRFVPPFSYVRMTWIKPSFCWLMERSNWGRKKGQECTLGVRITRSGWEKALSLGVLTSPEKAVHGDFRDWQTAFKQAKVHVQWDTERDVRGQALPHYAIQVGLTRHIVRDFVEEWIVEIEDLTPLVHKMTRAKRGGKNGPRSLVPKERIYPVDGDIARRLAMETDGDNTKHSSNTIRLT